MYVGPNGDAKVAGGVVSSEEAWDLSVDDNRNAMITPDASSFEYSIILLCQALRCNDATKRIQKMTEQLGVQISKTGKEQTISYQEDASVLESLAICYLALGRAQALMGQFDNAKESLRTSIVAVDSASKNESSSGANERNRHNSGGK